MITNKSSINFIKKIHKYGDILEFSVKKKDSNKKCFVLDFIKKESVLKSNINFYLTNQIINSPANLNHFNIASSTPIEGCYRNKQQEFMGNGMHPHTSSHNLTPKGYGYFQNGFMVPIQYSPMNYLMSDSVYLTNNPQLMRMNSMNNLNLYNNYTRLNLNNSNKFKVQQSPYNLSSSKSVSFIAKFL